MRPSHLKSAVALGAHKPHGTRLRYICGCKCMLCRAANSRYESERQQARKNGDWNGIVPALKAKRHIVALSRKGVGRRSIHEVTGIAETIIQEVKAGRRLHIRARTERLILNVDRKALGAAAVVPAGPTWQRINWLLREGFTKKELAKRLGYRSHALQINPNQVTLKNAVRVEQFYNRIRLGE